LNYSINPGCWILWDTFSASVDRVT
jgi:hypothetical protein